MIETSTRILDYVGAFMLIFVFLVFVYGIIYIHDIPHKIAKKRNHPHQDAIHAAGWLSLFLVHVIWPFLWIWALMHKPDEDTGPDGKPVQVAEQSPLPGIIPDKVEEAEETDHNGPEPAKG